jgi:hypothetical protein
MLEAEAHALNGDVTACLRALDRADRSLATAATSASPRPRVTFFDEIWLAGQRGTCLASLGRTDEAQAILIAAISSLAPTWANQRTWLLVMLARTYAKQREAGEACRLGAQALANIGAMGAAADLGLVQGLLRDLHPCRAHPDVQLLEQQVQAALVR